MGVSIVTNNGMPDQLKWLMAAVLVAGAVGGFYYFGDHSLLYRVIGIIVVTSVAVAIAFQTEKGRQAWALMQDARTELRKVVWPTRNETLQTTLIIIGVVTVTAIMLWMLDGLLAWLIRILLGRGA
jgi:preprotein translocase subunit SecE